MENSVVISIVSGLFGLLGIVVATIVGYRQTKITAKSVDQQTSITGVSSSIADLDAIARLNSAELVRVNKAHEDYVKKCDVDRLNFASQIGQQSGQIEVLKSIPLVNIDTTLQEISKFNKILAESNAEILKTLKSSAVIDAEDRDVLTNQSKHIRDEVGKQVKDSALKPKE